jgi:hypothetical protein
LDHTPNVGEITDLTPIIVDCKPRAAQSRTPTRTHARLSGKMKQDFAAGNDLSEIRACDIVPGKLKLSIALESAE